MKKLIFSFFVILSFTVFSYNFEKIEEDIEILFEKGDVPGVSIYIDSSTFVEPFELNYGYANLESKKEIHSEQQFRVGSITKSFTATAILILKDKGLISLDDKASKYVDINDKLLKETTIQDLMNMSSGIRGYINDDPLDDGFMMQHLINNPKRFLSPIDLVKHGLELTMEMGKAPPFHYSNTNYILLGMIIENVSEKSYEDFIIDEIIKPLNLKNTIVPSDYKPTKNLARGYQDLKVGFKDYTEIHPSYVWSAGSIISSAKDISKWIRSAYLGVLLDQKTRKFLYYGNKLAENVYYTAGLLKEPHRTWHNGEVIGYLSYAVYYPKNDISVAVLTNGKTGFDLKEKIIETIEEYIDYGETF